jgi:uncharacterized protein YfaS (alpha-2-macroglobulin family)
LEYLRDYPYSCLEQLTSRAWPLLRPETATQAPYGNDENNAEAVLADFVSSILALQLPEGGFSVWPGQRDADPWRSVNAIFFLVEAKAATPIPPDALEKACGYLRFVLVAPPQSLGEESFAYSCKAFAAFVLTRAGQPPLSWLQHLSEFEDKMLPSGRIFLAGAKALKAGNPDALRALDGKIPTAKNLVAGLNPSMESPLRNQSLLLYLWSLLAPADPATTGLCLDVANRLSRNTYLSTQEAGAAALALGAYLEATGGLSANTDYAAELSTERTPPLAVSGGQRFPLQGDALALSPDGTPPPVTVSVSRGRAYAVYSLRGAPLAAPEPMAAGIALKRVWKDAEGGNIDLSGGRVFLKKGDRVLVELTLESDSPLSDIAVSDLLPGGLEIENPRLKSTASAEETYDEERDWTSSTRTHMDAREDRLLLFFNRLSGTIVYRYSLRAVSSGTFVLPPLAAEAMYAPENRAVTSGGEVVVE